MRPAKPIKPLIIEYGSISAIVTVISNFRAVPKSYDTSAKLRKDEKNLKTIARKTQVSHEEVSDFLKHNVEEIAIVQCLLASAESGDKVYCEHEEQRLRYTFFDAVTRQRVIQFSPINNYYKYGDEIYVAMERGDLLGFGSFADAKLLVNVRTGALIARRRLRILTDDDAKIQAHDEARLAGDGAVKKTAVAAWFFDATSPEARVLSGVLGIYLDRLSPFKYRALQNASKASSTAAITSAAAAAGSSTAPAEAEKCESIKLKYVELFPYHGIDLSAYFNNVFRGKICVSTDLMLRIVDDTFAAVRNLHAKEMLHRDIKLENIFIKVLPNEPIEITLGDYGMAQKMQDGRYHGRRSCGTPCYMAPELFVDFRNNAPDSYQRHFDSCRQIQAERKKAQKLPDYNADTLVARHQAVEALSEVIATKPKEYSFSICSDTFAVGRCFDLIFFHDKHLPRGTVSSQLKNIIKLMLITHPSARLSLELAQLGVLFLRYSQLSSEQALHELLTRKKLPSMTLENFKALGQCLTVLRCFLYDTTMEWDILPKVYHAMTTTFIHRNSTTEDETIIRFLDAIRLLQTQFVVAQPTVSVLWRYRNELFDVVRDTYAIIRKLGRINDSRLREVEEQFTDVLQTLAVGDSSVLRCGSQFFAASTAAAASSAAAAATEQCRM